MLWGLGDRSGALYIEAMFHLEASDYITEVPFIRHPYGFNGPTMRNGQRINGVGPDAWLYPAIVGREPMSQL
ncbi:MAG: hypothetical protein KDD62_08195 [Bdellovibrionales bacterium]|nr:hypothetical protein [Bdellovibrionales bacterium]